MGSDKKQELLGIKLINNGILIRKKFNKTTTPTSSWKLGFHNSSDFDPNFSMNTSVSARKIGANLWEIQPQFNLYKSNGDDHDGGGGGGPIHHQRRRRRRSYEKQGFEVSDQLDEQPSGSNPQPPETETSLRKNKREIPIGKNGQDQQHVSSASCAGSMQATPTSYSLKTSRHLLKVLNRIWKLEEQRSSNVALIKALKRDLDISRAQIKTLVEERKMDHQEINELKRSTHEQEKKAARSTKDELLDLKSSFMREKKARILLESLCDEFAKGIRDYEQKVRLLEQNCKEKDQIMTKNEPDRLILHVTEAWLDERTQIKCDFSEKTSISDNLCCEIETFLEAKKKQSSQLVSRMIDQGPGPGPTEPCAGSMSRMASRGPGPGEPSSKIMSRTTDRGPGVNEPSSRSMPWSTDQGLGVNDPSSSRARDGIKSNSLMAKLVEARLESQLSKSRIIRR